MPNESKCTEASFSLIPTDVGLQVTQMPRSPKLMNFVLTMTVDKQTDHFTLCACAHGIKTSVILRHGLQSQKGNRNPGLYH